MNMLRLILISLLAFIGCSKTNVIRCEIIDKKIISSPKSFTSFDTQKIEYYFICKGNNEALKIDAVSYNANKIGDEFTFTETTFTILGYILCIVALTITVIIFVPIILFVD